MYIQIFFILTQWCLQIIYVSKSILLYLWYKSSTSLSNEYLLEFQLLESHQKNKHWHMSITFKLKSKVFLLWNKANKSLLNFIQIRFGFYAIRMKLNYIVLWYVQSWGMCFLITSYNSLTNFRKQYNNTPIVNRKTNSESLRKVSKFL